MFVGDMTVMDKIRGVVIVKSYFPKIGIFETHFSYNLLQNSASPSQVK